LFKQFVLSIFTVIPAPIFSKDAALAGKTVTLSKVIRVSVLLSIFLFIVSLFSMLVGPSQVETYGFLKKFLSGLFRGEFDLAEIDKTILFSIRLPRIICAGLVGASLASAGVIFQGLLRNPLADPYILGISGGSAVGAIIAIIVGLNALPFGAPGLSFLGALLTIILVYAIARTNREIKSSVLLLAGVIVNAFFSAVIMFLISTSSSSQIHSIVFWLMGDMSLVAVDELIPIGLCLVVGTVVMYAYTRHLNLIVAGEETAMQLGVDVERTKKILFLAASLVTGTAVSVSGIIGFVGLIIPHIVRMLLGSDHRLLLPASFLVGASCLVMADTIARTAMAPAELPVGVITALCGAPYFIYLLRRRPI